jgi:Na+/H+-dicarboxylate symporter
MSHKHAVLILYFIVLGMITGIAAGWFFGPKVLAIKWIGTIFLNALKMTIIPVILATVMMVFLFHLI